VADGVHRVRLAGPHTAHDDLHGEALTLFDSENNLIALTAASQHHIAEEGFDPV
jgi:hypothetical protein